LCVGGADVEGVVEAFIVVREQLDSTTGDTHPPSLNSHKIIVIMPTFVSAVRSRKQLMYYSHCVS
jgi:hypothetical protein